MVKFRDIIRRHHLSNLLPMAVTLFLAATATSCMFEDERDCPNMLPFTIKNNWQTCPDAAPEGMAYIFFSADGSEPWRFDFAGRDAGKVNIQIGGYKFLSFNDDTYNVLFRNEDGYDSYEAYTSAKDLLGSIPQNERGKSLPRNAGETTVECPDMMWSCAYCDFSLGYDGVHFAPFPATQPGNVMEYSPDFVLTAIQRPLTARYSFRIENIKNLSGVKSMSAALSGMAGAMMLASGIKKAYPSTLSLKASVIDSSTAGGNFCTFGIPDQPSAENILSLFVVIKDGRRFCYQFIVTNQVRTAPNPMNVSLIVKGLTLEKPEAGHGTGFDVAVDGWETVVVNIKG